MTKASDLRAEFGSVSQKEPLYIHDNNRKNQPVGSFKADALKFPKSLCSHCNNTRTQPHDLAWEKFSAAIRKHQPKISSGTVVRANRIFTYDTAREMLNMHLYFVKVLGCHIVEEQIPIEIMSFASAIKQGTAHPNIYLKFGIPVSFAGEPLRGASNALAAIDRSNGQVQFFTWICSPGNIAINVMYAVEGEKRDGLIGAWHPRLGTNKLVLHDFRDRKNDS